MNYFFEIFYSVFVFITNHVFYNISLKESTDLVFYAIENSLGGEIFVPKIPSYRLIDVAKAIDLYYTRFMNNESNVVFTDGSIKLESIQMINPKTDFLITSLNWGEDLKIKKT